MTPPQSEEDYVWIYKKLNAFWIHDGNPKHPHARLTSNRHSNGFFNSRLVIERDDVLRLCALRLKDMYSESATHLRDVDIVVGPQTGATRLATLLAIHIGESRGYSCRFASPRKGESANHEKVMIFDDEEQTVYCRDRVLLCEDVITTGESVAGAGRAVEARGGIVLPYILSLVNRSGQKEIGGRTILSLIDRHMPMWEADECPLCAQGSLAIRPKDNWDQLVLS